MRFGIQIFVASAFVYLAAAKGPGNANETEMQTLVGPPLQEGDLPWGRFFTFGASACHTPQIRGDDNFSPQINLMVPFPYYGRQLDFLFVSTNGALTNNTNGFFSSIPSQTLAIVPLLIDIDISLRPEGAVGNIWYHQTTSSSVLECGTLLIRSVYPSLNSFIATWAFIGTWHEVPLWFVPSSVRNTFQVVLLTDGSTSFIIYNYKKIDTNGGTAQAGFTPDGSANLFPLPGSGTTAIVDLVNLSNIGVPGQFVYRVDGITPTGPEVSLCQPHQMCNTFGIGNCSDSAPTCDSNAECIGDISIMTCSCITGFEGDGFTCTDINECLSSGVCGQNALCTNTIGSFDCNCKPGFTGDGFTCQDIDECADDACDQNGGKCINTEGSFSCLKKCGFERYQVCDFELSPGSVIQKSRSYGIYGPPRAYEGTYFLTTGRIYHNHISIFTNILRDWNYCLRFAYYGSNDYFDRWKLRVDVKSEIYEDVGGLAAYNSGWDRRPPYKTGSYELFAKVYRRRRTGHFQWNRNDWQTATVDIPEGYEQVKISMWKTSISTTIALDDVSLVSGSCFAEQPHA